MPAPPKTKVVSLLAACALLLPPAAVTQDSRPRRVPASPQQEVPRPAPTVQTVPQLEPTPAPQSDSIPEETPDSTAPAFTVAPLARLESEPTVRIGLTTSARSVTISTAGQLLLASNEIGGLLASPIPVAASRVRIEPRLLGPPPAVLDASLFRVELAALPDEGEAQAVARGARELTGEAAEVSRDARTNGWRVRVGRPAPRAEAEEMRARLEEAGVATFSIVGAAEAGVSPGNTKAASAANTNSPAPPARQANAGNTQTRSADNGTNTGRNASNSSGVRLTSRAALPTRGLAVYAAGATQLLNARAPVLFASADEQAAPLRFNERPYRGRLEVFTNLTGSLTVVNVVPLEDYVRGVVPNELSPGGYPAIEAHKAQAVAARTYAVSNRGRFASSGFDLLPTIRSQVYGGKSTEHTLTDRAVAETRGIVATYAGQPINALYTSTCGGHTEDADKIFGGAPAPYLRARACSIHARIQTLSQPAAISTLRTTREPVEIKDAERQRGPRDAAVLLVHGLRSSVRVTDDWLSDDLETADALALLELVSRLARRPPPAVAVTAATVRAPGFATALAHAIDGESRAAVLLDAASVDYLLALRDADEVPAANRADVAMLLRDGHLTLYPDATLRPRQQLTRARALRAVAGLLEARGLLQLQKANARQSPAGKLTVRGAKGPERTLDVAADAHLFRAYGETLYPVRALPLVGGEHVAFHTDARGAIDYLEARPAPNGASAERFSPFTYWTATLSSAEASQRLARYTRQAGAILDLRVASRGASGRALDLEIVGASGTAHVRGGRIRSALGLREQLFVIDRRYDESGRVASFVFTGRGFGHGVGLCQVGAYGLARAGLTYDRILKHYYTGIELTKAY
ncbi:MAG TPA: SpoIID/LytB domain-containing protein [Pyrinomonadaceae bacterium]|nr:SpoIID/LytB domain-containing protein [Pyrinomonadaceae bacterium]